MTNSGVVFDIKEFAIHDGPGIRTTVFLKGCPLRCRWCHNPEGLVPEPQEMLSPSGKRVAGRRYTPPELAAVISRQADILRMNDGGVTFSGGEPLFQAAFVSEVIDRLDGLHVLLDTSGYGSSEDFDRLAAKSDLVYFDLKLLDPGAHRSWTGSDNGPILRNLQALCEKGSPPFVIRVPLVPGVTDTEQNLTEIAETVLRLDRPPLRVDLLPYNRAAGGKYRACGMRFDPGFDEKRESHIDLNIFEERGIPVVLN
jgi:pyruvate formate lyase activating enzyme